MKQIKKLWKWYVPGILLGAAAGYVYYFFWGCDGSCLITSSPWRSILYGATMGGLLNSSFQSQPAKENATGK